MLHVTVVHYEMVTDKHTKSDTQANACNESIIFCFDCFAQLTKHTNGSVPTLLYLVQTNVCLYVNTWGHDQVEIQLINVQISAINFSKLDTRLSGKPP